MALEQMFFSAAAMTIGSICSRVLCEGGVRFASWVESQSDDAAQIIHKASEQYASNYANRHGMMKVLGMREPVPLESVYTAVQFLDRESISRFDSIEDLEKAFREQPDRRLQRKAKKIDGLRVANDKQYLMVLGGPGAGKSTFLRKMGLEALKGTTLKNGYVHECIPVLIELKNFASNEIAIEPAIAQEFRICGIPSPELVTTKLLEAGNLLILLDGLDEVPTKQMTDAIQQIQNFVDRYDKNRFVASCRLAAYRNNFHRFSDVAMADFDQEQVKQFIHRWFQSEEDLRLNTAQRCWNLLQQPEYAATKELAHTPLLLTLLCLVFEDSQTFPKNRAVLYGEALDVLLKKWASERRIQRDPIYQDLSIALEEMMLAEIAFTHFQANRLFFTKREVVEQIRSFLAENLNAPKHLDGELVLEAIAIQQGILVERAQEVYSFSHLTLQEYLAAQYIDDHNLTQTLVEEHLTHERWQEVFLLVAGVMRGGADALLLAMEAQANTFISTPKLKALLRWTDHLTSGAGGNLSPAAKRTTALFLALVNHRALNLARVLDPNLANTLELARTLANIRTLESAYPEDNTPARSAIPTRALAIALTRSLPDRLAGQAIAKTFTKTFTSELVKLEPFQATTLHELVRQLELLNLRSPDIRQSAIVLQEFHTQVFHTWFSTLKLDPTWISLSTEELRKLDRYLYANWLLVRCKQTAVRVSPRTWAGIEARLLRVSL